MMRRVEAPAAGYVRRAQPIAVTAAGAVLLGLVLLAVVRDPGLLLDLAKPVEMLHGLLSSAIVAGVGIALLGAVVTPLAQILAGAGALQKLLMGAVVALPLPFAQTADPGDGKAAGSEADTRAAAGSEYQIGAYTGWNGTMPSDVRFKQPNGTDLTIKDIKWLGHSFTEEPYWGARGTYWPARFKSLGFMFDYSHAKASAVKTQQLDQSGTRDGKPVPPSEPFSATFRKLEFTHGLNFSTLNAVYRLTGLHGKVVPYLGIGVGLSWPHVDTLRAGWEKDTRTYVHQITGPTVQVLGGLEWRVLRTARASAFTEYKLNYSVNKARLKGGGSLATNLWTHQVPVGISYHHRRVPK